MDAETLAAVRWARDEFTGRESDRRRPAKFDATGKPSPLVAGSHSCRRVRCAVAVRGRRLGPTAVRHGPPQQLGTCCRSAVRRQTPLVGTYFDESPPLQLTHAQLTKFDSVPGIQEVYRHGPISIYDLGGFGVPESRSGWFRQTQPTNIPTQVLFGLLLGVALAVIGRSDAGNRAAKFAWSIFTAAGPFLAFRSGLLPYASLRS